MPLQYLNVRLCVLVGCILTILFCSGCYNLTEVNDTAVCTGLGADLSRNKDISFAFQLAKPVEAGQSSIGANQTVVFSTTGKTPVEAARKSSLFLPRLPLYSQARLFIIGEQLAKTDLGLLGDFLWRNWKIRPDITVIVSSGATPEEIYQVSTPMALHSGHGLLKILDFQEKRLGIYTPIELEEMIYRLTTPGIEAIIPMVSIKKEGEKKQLYYNGSAIFSGPKMVGSFDEKQSQGYHWLNGRINTGGIISVHPSDDPENTLVFEVIDFHTRTRPVIVNNQLQMQIDIKSNLTFYDQTGNLQLTTTAVARQIEELCNTHIKQQVQNCIEQAQLLETDVLGWGLAVHRQQPDVWNQLRDQWPVVFPSIESKITVQTKIQRTNLSTGTVRLE